MSFKKIADLSFNLCLTLRSYCFVVEITFKFRISQIRGQWKFTFIWNPSSCASCFSIAYKFKTFYKIKTKYLSQLQHSFKNGFFRKPCWSNTQAIHYIKNRRLKMREVVNKTLGNMINSTPAAEARNL